jgi:AcrR family transcriptional regulator
MPPSGLTAESTSRTDRRRARNRDALVAAARRLFIQDGFEATTIAGIAEAADLGFGTFYRYFPDKEAALRAVLEQSAEEMDELLLEEPDPAVAASDALISFSERFVRTSLRNRPIVALWWEMSMRSDTRRPYLRENLAFPGRVRGAIERIIARGVERGEFVACDVPMAAGMLTGAHMFVLTTPIEKNEVEHVIETLVALESRALGSMPVGNTSARQQVRRGR